MLIHAIKALPGPQAHDLFVRCLLVFRSPRHHDLLLRFVLTGLR